MKVGTFHPIIFTDNLEKELELYTTVYGFSVNHRPEELKVSKVMSLKNEHGDCVELAENPHLKPGTVWFRMNVDNLEEAVSYFKDQGYTELKGNEDTEHCDYANMMAPSGLVFNVVKHLNID